MTSRIVPSDPAGLAAAIDVLRSGGLVGLPTDTVYGIAVALDTPGGIERLFAAKARPPEKGIILLLADIQQAASIGILGPSASALAEAFWPGGLSLVVGQHPGARLPSSLTGGAATIGLRVPAHPAPRALAAAVGPLPTTSANRSGEPEAPDAAGVVAALGSAVDLVVDGGPSKGGPASTVVDCTGEPASILRAGAVPRDALVLVLREAGLREPA
ncbi:MAG: L-threonylcarbamoyladenylate synthase [Chloroflexota bacterium]